MIERHTQILLSGDVKEEKDGEETKRKMQGFLN